MKIFIVIFALICAASAEEGALSSAELASSSSSSQTSTLDLSRESSSNYDSVSFSPSSPSPSSFSSEEASAASISASASSFPLSSSESLSLSTATASSISEESVSKEESTFSSSVQGSSWTSMTSSATAESSSSLPSEMSSLGPSEEKASVGSSSVGSSSVGSSSVGSSSVGSSSVGVSSVGVSSAASEQQSSAKESAEAQEGEAEEEGAEANPEAFILDSFPASMVAGTERQFFVLARTTSGDPAGCATANIISVRLYYRVTEEPVVSGLAVDMLDCENGRYEFKIAARSTGEYIVELHYDGTLVHDFPVALNVSAGAPEPNNTAYISEPETSVLVEKPIEFSIGLFDANKNPVLRCDYVLSVAGQDTESGAAAQFTQTSSTCEDGVTYFRLAFPQNGVYDIEIKLNGDVLPGLSREITVKAPCSAAEGEEDCSGHGICAENGCVCDDGYFGEYCSGECQPSASSPCHDHGTCDKATGTCSCDDGYRGTSCGIPCQGGASTPCYGNGICKEDGSCECYSGYTGDACLYEDREVEEAGSTTVLIVLVVITVVTIICIVMVVIRKRWSSTQNVRMAYQHGGFLGGLRAIFMRQPAARRYVYHDDL